MIGTAGRLVGHFYIHNGTIQPSFANAAEFFNSLLASSASKGPWPEGICDSADASESEAAPSTAASLLLLNVE
ncbi:hypothetical protein ACVWZL_009129 [Bradyrhizobium sp. GM2.4]